MELDTLNLTQICRTCKCVAPEMRSLFEGYENVHQSPRIDDMLMTCASVQVKCGDGLPAQICQICVEQLRNAFIFKRQVERIDANLKEYVKNFEVNEIKEEPLDSDFMESLNTLNTLLNEQVKQNNQELSNPPVIPKLETDHIQFLDNDQILLTCRECSKVFSTLKGLRLHKRVHTGNLYECSKCFKQFSKLNYLQRHEKLHARKKVYVCKICSRTIMNMEQRKRHLMTHLKEKPFSCNTCNRVFSRAEHLHNHTPRCKGDVVYSCDTCNKAFSRESNLEVHKKMHDNQPKLLTIENLDNIEEHYYQVDQDVDTVFSDYSDVDDCFEPQIEVKENVDGDEVKEVVDISLNDEESIISETSLAGGKDDDNSHDSSKEKVTECLENEVDDLKEEVKLEDNLELEDNIVEDEDKIIHIERDAGENSGGTTDSEYVPKKSVPPRTKRGRARHKGFTTEKYQDSHVNGHNGQKEYRCRACEKTFLAKSHLTEHMKVHKQRPKKFLCSECGQRFIRNDYLITHMRRHRGEKPYKCKFCGKGFARTTDLTVHERYHTGEKTHLCTICGKGFGRGYNLTVHMRTHTGEKPYQCTYCNAAFAQGNDLKGHIRRHTGERYHCEFCSESFLMGYLLTQHKRTVHGMNVVCNVRRLQPVDKEENADTPPPITISLPKPVVPDVMFNA